MLKRTLSFALTLALVLCMLASCELLGIKDAAGIIDAADKAAESIDYTVNTSVVFTSDDEDMKAVISSLGEISMSFAKKGHGSRSKVSVNLDGALTEKEYLISSGVLYYTHTRTEGETEVSSVKQKVLLNTEEKKAITEDVGMKAPLSYADFDSVKVESSGNVDLLTCEGIKAESMADMIKLLESNLGIENSVVKITDAQLVVRLVDGNYNGEYISICYTVEIGEVSYEVRMQLSREYDVTTAVDVSAPSDADQYVTTTYGEMAK